MFILNLIIQALSPISISRIQLKKWKYIKKCITNIPSAFQYTERDIDSVVTEILEQLEDIRDNAKRILEFSDIKNKDELNGRFSSVYGLFLKPDKTNKIRKAINELNDKVGQYLYEGK